MANITQTIPNLTQGISQQPDEYKIPGQVKDMVNTLPDITQGLLKRPAGKFVGSLSDGSKNSSANGRWFHYYRDETEQYIGQIHQDGTVRMWDCLTGAEKNVVDATTSGSLTYVDDTTGSYKYLKHSGDEDIQTLTLNDFTYLTNRQVKTEMDALTEPDTNYKKEIFVELKTLSYAKQYALNIFDQDGSQTSHFSTVTTATRINVELVRSSNNYCDANGFMRTHANRGTNPYGRCDDSAGDGRDAYAPNVATRIFSIDSGKALTDEGATGGIKADTNQSDIEYDYNVSVYNQAGTAGQSGRKNLYFRIATTGQSVPYTTGSGETQTTTYQARYTTTYDLLHGGEGWLAGDYFYVWMKDGFYKVTVETTSESKVQANLALVRPQPTPFDTETTITAESILGDIRTAIVAGGNISDSDITTIGTGLHIKRNAVFNASTPVGELLNVVAGKVNDVGDLPSQCKHGMVIEVVNSNADEDNHYVKFFGKEKDDGTFLDGEGVWEECAKPGRKIRFKRHSMPVALIRTADGNFRLAELDGATYTISSVDYKHPQWDDCIVGDEVTNAEPSFVGKGINKMLFFRNRLALLADENIVLSRPGDFFNFWAKSAIAFVPSDPIDLSASSEYPAILYDGIQVNTGLILFTKNQQFMLTTDSDVLSIQTAKINAISSYNFNYTTNPISLGTTVGFLDNAGKYSRFFEMAGVLREGEPQVIEQSAVVSRLFNKDLKLISNSRENSVIFFSEEGTSTLYGYRYFDQINDRKMASWFKWTVTGDIQYHCMQDDALYVVVKNNSKDQLLKYSLKMDSNTFTVDTTNRVHLDHLMSTNGWSYNATTNKSTKAKPTGLESTNQLAAYDVDDTVSSGNPTNAIGRYAEITVNGSNLELTGDWSGQTFLIGYLFTMQVDIPTIYYRKQSGATWQSDTRANTVVHRVKLGFGPVGIYETTVTRTGKPNYDDLFEVTPADQYLANYSGIFDDNVLRTVPIYDRNTNTSLTIKSTHPAPATLHNMTWEGVYNNNYYERV